MSTETEEMILTELRELKAMLNQLSGKPRSKKKQHKKSVGDYRLELRAKHLKQNIKHT